MGTRARRWSRKPIAKVHGESGVSHQRDDGGGSEPGQQTNGKEQPAEELGAVHHRRQRILVVRAINVRCLAGIVPLVRISPSIPPTY